MTHRPLVSVVLATYERAPLLARSLVCYERSAGLYPPDDLELVVIDDHSTDGTRDLVLDWSKTTGVRAVVLTASPKPAEWVDCGHWLNVGIRASTGRHVLLTHPEVMVGRRSVAACVEQLEYHESSYDIGVDEWRRQHPFGLYACCRVYYLSPQDQTRLDTVPWREEGALAVRQIAGFYTDDTNGHPDYCHRATDLVAQPKSRIPTWESFVFGGHSRETWRRLGGMLETREWGSVDIAWSHRRRTLGIPNHTCPADDTIVVHQNHDLPGNVVTDRDTEKWKRELAPYPLSDAAKLVYPYVDNL